MFYYKMILHFNYRVYTVRYDTCIQKNNYNSHVSVVKFIMPRPLIGGALSDAFV